MVRLAESDSAGGFINITNSYYDFHRALTNPTLSKLDVYSKVLDDKLMETKFVKKKMENETVSPLKIGGSIYRKAVYQLRDEEGEDDRKILGIKRAESEASTNRSAKYDEEFQDFQKLNKQNRKNTLERMYQEKYEERYDIF
jgi:hypothetical protein